MIEYLSSGIILGLSAGLSPGPLLALLVRETLAHETIEGLKVSLVPLITDPPIILISLLLVGKLAQFQTVFGVISLLGGVFVLFLAYESFTSRQLLQGLEDIRPRSIQKGIIVNLLNPHPYLFWITVGAPIVIKATWSNSSWGVLFVAVFYLLLVGVKALLAILLGRYRKFISDTMYAIVMRLLGVALGLFSFVLFHDGLQLIGGIQ